MIKIRAQSGDSQIILRDSVKVMKVDLTDSTALD